MKNVISVFASLILIFTVLFLNTGCEKENLLDSTPTEATKENAAASRDETVESRDTATSSPFRAWVWANEPTNPAYTPSTWYQYVEGSTFRITIKRNSAGKYTVTIPNAGQHVSGVPQVVGYGSNNSAQVSSWNSWDNNLMIHVSVFSPNAQPVDGEFVLFFYKESDRVANTAYQWVDYPLFLTSFYRYNPKGENRVIRVGTGRYELTFSGIDEDPYASSGQYGNVIATAYGREPRRIKISGWSHAGDQVKVTVQLYNASGLLADGQFIASYISDFSLGQCNSSDCGDYGAYVWADNPTAASYTPSLSYQVTNSSATRITIQRLGTGFYKVTLPNIKSTNSTMAIATAYGSTGNYVAIEKWIGNTSGGTDVFVKCFTQTGTEVNGQFTLFYYTNEDVLY